MHKRIGNLMGRANVMTNIGSVLARQRQGDEALEALQQARILYQQIGAKTRGAEVVEKIIARLEKKKAKRSS